jgi:chemotaxis regulatin CheY-phosphate phosphatase CheZ
MSDQETVQAKSEKEIVELTDVITDLVVDFKRLRDPLIESHQKVPQATDQLDSINEQTEAVTHRMLDMIEAITRREEDVMRGLENIKEITPRPDQNGVGSIVDSLTAKAQANLNDTYLMMESLQFQDITAQQIHHAASLLEEIEDKLRYTLSTVCDESVHEQLRAPRAARKTRAFAPNVDLAHARRNQKDIDSLFDQNKHG